MVVKAFRILVDLEPWVFWLILLISNILFRRAFYSICEITSFGKIDSIFCKSFSTPLIFEIPFVALSRVFEVSPHYPLPFHLWLKIMGCISLVSIVFGHQDYLFWIHLFQFTSSCSVFRMLLPFVPKVNCILPLICTFLLNFVALS